MKKSFIYKQYGLYPLPYPIKDYVDGWLSEYQTIWKISHKNMQIQGKIDLISSYCTAVFSSWPCQYLTDTIGWWLKIFL